MKIAVISDVHSNIEALRAVLADIDSRGAMDAILFAGDAVGYGPEPNECVSLIKVRATLCVAGNHDHGALGLTEIKRFNYIAQEAIEWTAGVISDDTKKALGTWPMRTELADADLLMVHSSPDSPPDHFKYVYSTMDMLKALGACTNRFCVVAHTHMPYVTELTDKRAPVYHGAPEHPIKLASGSRFLVNPGSVGQPRNQDNRATYALITEELVEIVRVRYDIDKTVVSMAQKGIHLALQERLRYGF